MFLIFAIIVAAVAAAAGAAAAGSAAGSAQSEAARANAEATRRAAEQAADAQRNAAAGEARVAAADAPILVGAIVPLLVRLGARPILLTGLILSLGLITAHLTVGDLPVGVRGDNPPEQAGEPEPIDALDPTATATRTPTPRPTHTSTPTPAPVTLTMRQNANCRKGPGVAYNIVTSFLQGAELIAIGRNAESTWWYVESPESEACWLGDASAEKVGPLEALTMLVGPPLPESPYVFYDETICTKKVFKVTLYWQDVSDEVGYHVYRNGVFLDAVERNRTKFINYAPFGQDLVYELESFNENGVSERLETTVLACTK